MSRSGRLAIVLAMFAVVVAAVVWAAFNFVGSEPATVDLAAGHQTGATVHLIAQTDGAVGTGAHPTWVSYQVWTPHDRQWVHTTLWQLPAHTHVDVTIFQFDSGSPLRNQFFGRVTGTRGGVARLNGRPFKVINSNEVTVGHTFTVPTLNLSVPLKGVTTGKPGFCTVGPCSPANQLNNRVTFSFTTPGPGNYRFQCFIPCGGGRLFGNGGPMQTLGYMGGFLEVV